VKPGGLLSVSLISLAIASNIPAESKTLLPDKPGRSNSTRVEVLEVLEVSPTVLITEGETFGDSLLGESKGDPTLEEETLLSSLFIVMSIALSIGIDELTVSLNVLAATRVGLSPKLKEYLEVGSGADLGPLESLLTEVSMSKALAPAFLKFS
jgi:hypothetical protein